MPVATDQKVGGSSPSERARVLAGQRHYVTLSGRAVSGDGCAVVWLCLPMASVAGDNRSVSTVERPLPPLNADERTTLESWLDFHRSTLAMKCEGLDDKQAAAASVPPSVLTLTGIIQHMAEV